MRSPGERFSAILSRISGGSLSILGEMAINNKVVFPMPKGKLRIVAYSQIEADQKKYLISDGNEFSFINANK